MRVQRKIAPSLLCGIIAVATMCVSAAADGMQRITFDHETTPNGTAVGPFTMHHGEEFEVAIKNYSDEFSYDIAGIESTTAPAGAVDAPAAPKPKAVTRVHNRKFAGYWVHATRLPSTKPAISKLENRAWLILVDTTGWETDFAGGFTVSRLTNPVFETRPVTTDGTTVQKVERNRSAEDSQALGLAAFVHVHHDRVPCVAMSFGLGVSDQSKATYYMGGSWLWGSKGALTVGYAWGPVDRLPRGVREGDTVTDVNTLGKLDSKIESGFFFALSYSFISVGDRLKKPFAQTDKSQQ